MRYLILSLILCLSIPVSIQAGATVHVTTQEQLSTKKTKKGLRIKKKPAAMTSKTKGIISLVAGGLTLLSFVLSINFLIASVPVALPIITMLMILGFGIAAIVFGIQAVKEDNDSKGFGLAGIISGGIGLLVFIGLIIAFSQFPY